MIITLADPLPCCALAVMNRRCGMPTTAAQLTRQQDSSYHLQPFCPAHLPAERRGEYVVPEEAPVVACRSCGAQIVWTKTPTGRPMPLSLATVEARGGVRFALAHFSDCPDGKDWSHR